MTQSRKKEDLQKRFLSRHGELSVQLEDRLYGLTSSTLPKVESFREAEEQVPVQSPDDIRLAFRTWERRLLYRYLDFVPKISAILDVVQKISPDLPGFSSLQLHRDALLVDLVAWFFKASNQNESPFSTNHGRIIFHLLIRLWRTKPVSTILDVVDDRELDHGSAALLKHLFDELQLVLKGGAPLELQQFRLSSLFSRVANRCHLRCDTDNPLVLFNVLRVLEYRLVTLFANDEQQQIDRCFKVYYLLSHPTCDLFVLLEYVLPPKSDMYYSIQSIYPGAKPLELEVQQLFGLKPHAVYDEKPVSELSFERLHTTCYPEACFPLRRNTRLVDLKDMLDQYPARERTPFVGKLADQEDGSYYLPMGPVYGGVTEPGYFLFRSAGERIDHLNIRLGYTHKGLERLFQAHTLWDGWQVAERVSGDSCFAHGLAYCRAVEDLCGTTPPKGAVLVRGFFLELERIQNHLGDIACLVKAVALDHFAADVALWKEHTLTLCRDLIGRRFIKGLLRPGGLCVGKDDRFEPRLFQPDVIDQLELTRQRLNITIKRLSGMSSFRDRFVDVGVLEREDARRLDATGLVARASGLETDFRLLHPMGVDHLLGEQRKAIEFRYRFREPTPSILDTNLLEHLYEHADEKDYLADLFSESQDGDAFARLMLRVREVNVSVDLIKAMARIWNEELPTCFFVKPEHHIRNNFTFGVGYAEGWRGNIVYWIMQDKFARIYRCKVRDPSTLNWPLLSHAVRPKSEGTPGAETLLSDFPLIHQSFNLSYSANDL